MQTTAEQYAFLVKNDTGYRFPNIDYAGVSADIILSVAAQQIPLATLLLRWTCKELFESLIPADTASADCVGEAALAGNVEVFNLLFGAKWLKSHVTYHVVTLPNGARIGTNNASDLLAAALPIDDLIANSRRFVDGPMVAIDVANAAGRPADEIRRLIDSWVVYDPHFWMTHIMDDALSRGRADVLDMILNHPKWNRCLYYAACFETRPSDDQVEWFRVRGERISKMGWRRQLDALDWVSENVYGAEEYVAKMKRIYFK